VWAVDTETQLDRIDGILSEVRSEFGDRLCSMSIKEFSSSRLRLDAAVIVCVLHTIPSVKARKDLLRAIRRNVKKGGKLLVDVPFGEPYYRRKMTMERRYRDGYLMGCGSCRTFYKEFDEEEIKSLVEEFGFLFELKLDVRRHHALVFQT